MLVILALGALGAALALLTARLGFSMVADVLALAAAASTAHRARRLPPRSSRP